MIKSFVLGMVALIACTDAAMAQNRQQGQRHNRQPQVYTQRNVVVNRNVTYNTNMAYPYSNGGYRGGWYGGDPYNSGVAMTAIQGGTAVILGMIGLAGQQQAQQQQPRVIYVPCPYRSCQ